jgi:predicted TIM-barrel fold metal-dependent hydrolase
MTSVQPTVTETARPTRTRPPVVDCDIHNAPVSEAALLAYMPDEWRRRRAAGGRLDAAVEARRETLGDRSYLGSEYPRATPRAARTDAWPPTGGPPASDVPFMREQLLDRFEIQYGVLTPMLGAGEQLDLERGAALASAINDWQIAEWLEREPRLRASINIAYEDGELAAREIHRLGQDPRFVQALMLIRTAEPMGRRKYWKIYEAAVAHDLPVGVHYGGWGRGPITGVGFGSFYIEDSVGMATAFQDQLTSMVCEGVFERFPSLRIVLIEGGVAWMAPLMWRLDRAWKLLRTEAPRLNRLPSELIREHVWLTTQPIDEPPRDQDFAAMLEQMGMSDHILFATDYPHWDFDAPDRALPRGLSDEVREGIMGGNAHRCYRLTAAAGASQGSALA